MRKRWIAILISGVLALLVIGIAYAAANGFSLDWWTVDGGGGTSQGGGYAVSGTIGQPDTSPLMRGGDYEVVGGFWGGELVIPEGSNYIFLPIIMK